jgi:hypothetical protein
VVERLLAKEKVAGSSPVSRSRIKWSVRARETPDTAPDKIREVRLMKNYGKAIFLISVFVLFLLMPLIVCAEDDFALPPPPDASEDLLPPPPGDSGGFGGDADMPPPPGDDMGDLDMAPPPDEEAGGDLPPPPDEGGDELAPPPADEMAEEAPPPPGEEEMAPPPMEEEPAKVTKKPSGRYSVAGGDSLWRISGKSVAYRDSFKWPLLFKANRDIIEDPDLIYPRQKLEIRKSYTEAEMEDAVGKAKETPPFEPHTVPRKSLPIKY